MLTSRLHLLPSEPAHLLALCESSESFQGRSGLEPAEGLREFFVSDDVSAEWLESLRSAAGADPWHFGYLVVLREGNRVIGSAGFKGPPDAEGVVEIAYGIVPAHEGQGFATEAAQGLISIASGHEQTRLLRAHTLPEKNASNSILKKCGFEFVGEVVDPEDGPVWRWERGLGD